MLGDFKPRFSPVPLRQLSLILGFTSCRSALYTAIVNILRLRGKLTLFLRSMLVVFLLFSLCARSIHAQETMQKPSEKAAKKKAEKAAPPEKVENPAQIELLETSYRFEANGDSRKEVHTRVKINSELGVRQFARLNFDYNRSFQSIEIPLVHITHSSGGTADILPSAITDNPNPAVVDAPAYQDVRVKSVRILGLEPGDLLEYRVITTTAHHPLAPDFWLEHTFDRTGVVTQEVFELDLPANREVELRVGPEAPAASTLTSGEQDSSRKIYRWQRTISSSPNPGSSETSPARTDISLTTFASWRALSERLATTWRTSGATEKAVTNKAMELAGLVPDENLKLQILYEFVSMDIKTVDLPLFFSGFRSRSPEEILSSGYAAPLDKLRLLDSLSSSLVGEMKPAFFGNGPSLADQLPIPSLLVHMVASIFIGNGPIPDGKGHGVMCDHCGTIVWLDPALEVAPYRMLRADERGKLALFAARFPGEGLPSVDNPWRKIPADLPFASTQRVDVNASIATDGKLSAKVHYSLRGDNELLLRVAFHQSPKEKWKELAQLLSISDGFRGQVTSVNASDPYATREPFTLDYEITMSKFVDWSKKPVRIPALLPQLGLPDPPAKPVAGAATSPIELGTPLEVETRMTLRLPPGTTAQTPTGTSVQRDYATYASQYSAKGPSITASRHINFLLREIPANRAVDYNSFLRAVQSDEAQDLTLLREEGTTPEKRPAAPKSSTPMQAAAVHSKP
jgi:hypothetical protein